MPFMSPFSEKWLPGKWWLLYMICCMFRDCCRLLPRHVKQRTDHYDSLLGHSYSVFCNSDTNILWECDLWLKIDSPWIISTCWIYLCHIFITLFFTLGGCKRRPSLPEFRAQPWVLIVICLRPPSFGKVRSHLRHKNVIISVFEY